MRLSSVIVLSLVLSACSGGGGQPQAQGGAPKPGGQGGPGGMQKAIPAVEAVEAKYGRLPLEERFSGVVRANNQVDITPMVSGIVAAVYVENGQRVTKGQVLVRLRDEEFRQRMSGAESGWNIAKAQEQQAAANFREVEANFNRTKELVEKKLTSDLELETGRARLDASKAAWELAKARTKQAYASWKEQEVLQSQFEIRSPVDGYVGTRAVEVGQMVSTQDRIFVVGDLDLVRVQFTVSENMLRFIREGQAAILSSEAFADQPIRTALTRISPFLNPVTHTTQAEIELTNEQRSLRPGMFVTVDILYGESELATLVPNAAIYKDPRTGIEGVWLASQLGVEVKPNTEDAQLLTEPMEMKFMPVQVLARGRTVSGIAGLESGKWIVCIGQNLLMGQTPKARVRAAEWTRILTMQELRDSNLLDILTGKSAIAVVQAVSPSAS
jgi:RND family efflux transporter MFP subunit